jgi:2-polyprenyl-6-hydroxyphenyl methylase / 3-demethylubiquinone-9 3-methyltransferase
MGGIRVTLVQVRRNDIRQYDRLAGEWWRPEGLFAMLHWLAAARARLVPPAGRAGEVLVDLGCGGGLLAPHLAGKGYRHVGVDLVASALDQAGAHGVVPVRGDATRLPLRDGCAAVVSAGELLEHVVDLRAAIAEACRILRPGGLLVLDTLNATPLARLIAVTIGERIPGVAPRGIHDPALFVAPRVLVDECAGHGVRLEVRGVRPSAAGLGRWLVTRRGAVAIRPSASTAVLYQARGFKLGGPSRW